MFSHFLTIFSKIDLENSKISGYFSQTPHFKEEIKAHLFRSKKMGVNIPTFDARGRNISRNPILGSTKGGYVRASRKKMRRRVKFFFRQKS